MMCLFLETMLSQHALLPLRPAPQDTLTSVTSDTLLEADTAYMVFAERLKGFAP